MEPVLLFVAKHIEFFIGLLFAALGFLGFGGLRKLITTFDKDGKILFLVKETHSYLDRIKDKTNTNLDNHLEVMFAAVEDFLERKEEFVSLSDEEKRKAMQLAKTAVVKQLQERNSAKD